MKNLVILTLASIIGLTGCSTMDKVRDLNPFGENSTERAKREQGVLPDEERRVSVLVFEQSLKADAGADATKITLPPSYENDDWAQVGAYPSHAPQHLQGATDLKVLWKSNAGKGSYSKGWIMTQPVIAGGKLFAMDAAGNVRAIDLASHKRVWNRSMRVKLTPAPKEDRPGRFSGGFRGVVDKMRSRRGEGYGGGLAVSGGILYVTSGYGHVTALDVNNGDIKWQTDTPTPMHGAPTVADGRVYTVSQDDELVALNAKTGDIEWTFQGIVESARMLTPSAPAVYGEFVVAPFASGELGAFRAQTGRDIWSDGLTRQAGLTALSDLNDVAASPAIFDNTVYAISHSGLLAATDLRTGERRWSRQVGGVQMPWIAGNTIYIVSNDGQVAALSRKNGMVLWVKQLRGFKNEKKKKKRIAWAGPVLVSSHLVLVSSRGELVTLSPENGKIVSRKRLKGEFFLSPVVAKGVLYLLSNEGRVYALQ